MALVWPLPVAQDGQLPHALLPAAAITLLGLRQQPVQGLEQAHREVWSRARQLTTATARARQLLPRSLPRGVLLGKPIVMVFQNQRSPSE